MRLRPRRLLMVVSAAGFSVIFCACGGGSSPQSAAIALPSVVPGAGSSIEVGAWVKPSNLSGTAQNIAVLESEIGRRLNIGVHYDSFTSTFPSTDELNDKLIGRTPEVSWDCGGTDADVAAGKYDVTILAEAKNMAAFGAQILLRYKWEFNLPTAANNRSPHCVDPVTDADGYFSPAKFVAAWQHIHNLFVAAGATNVVFLWNPDAGSGSQSAVPYFPGDAYVDWIGIDAYDWSGRGLVATLAPGYAAYASLGNGTHPFMVGETGATGPNQPTYLDGNSRANLAAQFPLLTALSYFDAVGPAQNWSLTPAGLASFKAFADQ